MDLIITKIEVLGDASISFTRGEVLQKYYPYYTTVAFIILITLLIKNLVKNDSGRHTK